MQVVIKGCTVLLDDGDWDNLKHLGWRIAKHHNKKYVYGSNNHMHRIIMGLPKGAVGDVDHINGNGLDNRRENLRICTRQENSRNSAPRSGAASKYKGVVISRQGTYRARISDGKTLRSLGTYKTEVEAAVAYNIAATTTFGSFARLNKISI